MRISQTGQFKRDVKRLAGRGKDVAKLKAVVGFLLTGASLPIKHRDHPLKGNWKDRRDCHVEPDWILIYRRTADELRLERTGTHADLF